MPASELIVCAAGEVFILRLPDDGHGPEKIWSWRGPDKRFAFIAECKPVDGGRRILIASATDGVAVVERATGRVEFEATVPNAHSADLLPDGRVVVASSHRGLSGDRLVLIEGARIPLTGAHGVVWDAERTALWAIGAEELRRYDSSLELLSGHPLPDSGGHDLYPVPATADLAVTTNSSCWLFNRETLEFRPHPALAGRACVKSVDVHSSTRQVVYVQAEPGGWWSEWVRFAAPEAELSFDGQKIYKARWLGQR